MEHKIKRSQVFGNLRTFVVATMQVSNHFLSDLRPIANLEL